VRDSCTRVPTTFSQAAAMQPGSCAKSTEPSAGHFSTDPTRGSLERFFFPQITVRYRTWIDDRDDTLLHSMTGVGRVELSIEQQESSFEPQQGQSINRHKFFQTVRHKMASTRASRGSEDRGTFLDSQARSAIWGILSETLSGAYPFPDLQCLVTRVHAPTIVSSNLENSEWLIHQQHSPMVGDVLSMNGEEPAWTGWEIEGA